ncbi:MAG: DUF952 domain-containing protein [Puniceicoccales bacterium]|jgi:uncharacterized protein (DUF952 family)|nr:DUF952 domain-containing protein [Puniceicoccales bacterium]
MEIIFSLPTKEKGFLTEKIELMHRMIVSHVATANQWESSGDFYCDCSIKKDGFIHYCTVENVVEIANDNLKKMQESLIILVIDVYRLNAIVRWEIGKKSGQKCPHIYGLLNRSAGIDTIKFEKDYSGHFLFPGELPKDKK